MPREIHKGSMPSTRPEPTFRDARYSWPKDDADIGNNGADTGLVMRRSINVNHNRGSLAAGYTETEASFPDLDTES